MQKQQDQKEEKRKKDMMPSKQRDTNHHYHVKGPAVYHLKGPAASAARSSSRRLLIWLLASVFFIAMLTTYILFSNNASDEAESEHIAQLLHQEQQQKLKQEHQDYALRQLNQQHQHPREELESSSGARMSSIPASTITGSPHTSVSPSLPSSVVVEHMTDKKPDSVSLITSNKASPLPLSPFVPLKRITESPRWRTMPEEAPTCGGSVPLPFESEGKNPGYWWTRRMQPDVLEQMAKGERPTPWMSHHCNWEGAELKSEQPHNQCATTFARSEEEHRAMEQYNLLERCFNRIKPSEVTAENKDTTHLLPRIFFMGHSHLRNFYKSICLELLKYDPGLADPKFHDCPKPPCEPCPPGKTHWWHVKDGAGRVILGWEMKVYSELPHKGADQHGQTSPNYPMTWDYVVMMRGAWDIVTNNTEPGDMMGAMERNIRRVYEHYRTKRIINVLPSHHWRHDFRMEELYHEDERPPWGMVPTGALYNIQCNTYARRTMYWQANFCGTMRAASAEWNSKPTIPVETFFVNTQLTQSAIGWINRDGAGFHFFGTARKMIGQYLTMQVCSGLPEHERGAVKDVKAEYLFPHSPSAKNPTAEESSVAHQWFDRRGVESMTTSRAPTFHVDQGATPEKAAETVEWTIKRFNNRIVAVTKAVASPAGSVAIPRMTANCGRDRACPGVSPNYAASGWEWAGRLPACACQAPQPLQPGIYGLPESETPKTTTSWCSKFYFGKGYQKFIRYSNESANCGQPAGAVFWHQKGGGGPFSSSDDVDAARLASLDSGWDGKKRYGHPFPRAQSSGTLWSEILSVMNEQPQRRVMLIGGSRMADIFRTICAVVKESGKSSGEDRNHGNRCIGREMVDRNNETIMFFSHRPGPKVRLPNHGTFDRRETPISHHNFSHVFTDPYTLAPSDLFHNVGNPFDKEGGDIGDEPRRHYIMEITWYHISVAHLAPNAIHFMLLPSPRSSSSSSSQDPSSCELQQLYLRWAREIFYCTAVLATRYGAPVQPLETADLDFGTTELKDVTVGLAMRVAGLSFLESTTTSEGVGERWRPSVAIGADQRDASLKYYILPPMQPYTGPLYSQKGVERVGAVFPTLPAEWMQLKESLSTTNPAHCPNHVLVDRNDRTDRIPKKIRSTFYGDDDYPMGV